MIMAPLLQTACSSFKKLARVCMLHSNNALRVYAAENARDSIKQKRGPRGIMGNLIYYYAGSNSVYGTGNLHYFRPAARAYHAWSSALPTELPISPQACERVHERGVWGDFCPLVWFGNTLHAAKDKRNSTLRSLNS